jgi:hypothetical protein
MDNGKLFQDLGLGLSRVLRYSYGGFLLLVLAVILDRSHCLLPVIEAVDWKLTVLSALLAGAAIYSIHRSVVIPATHLGLCGILWIWDSLWKTDRKDSNSPTLWLGGALGVKRGEKIMAYTALRHSNLFTNQERQEMDVAHAENGLVVMTFEGFATAAFFVWWFHPESRTMWITLRSLSAFFFVVPYVRAFADHQVEGMRLRANERYARRLLGEFGFTLVDPAAPVKGDRALALALVVLILCVLLLWVAGFFCISLVLVLCSLAIVASILVSHRWPKTKAPLPPVSR